MPVENERKFIIQISSEDQIEDLAYDCKIIGQGYTVVDKNIVTRVRYDTGDYYFTYKHFINNECIEIETEISQSDFHKLWAVATNKINKYRYLLKDDENLYTWEIDYIYEGDETYLAIAEIEMPENSIFVTIPKFVKDNLIYAVPQGNSKFQNCYLHDRNYVEDLLEDIKHEGRSKLKQNIHD